jgi:hypothetical protein
MPRKFTIYFQGVLRIVPSQQESAFDQNVEYCFEYGKQIGNYTITSPIYTNLANALNERDIDKLLPNTQISITDLDID